MATVVELPRLSDTMEEGVIAKWRVKVGDKVKRGQVIADIETDKATMEFESFDAGTVLKLIASEGDTLPLGAPIAVLGQPGEDAESAAPGKPADGGEKAKPAADAGEAKAKPDAGEAKAAKPAQGGDAEGQTAAKAAEAKGAAGTEEAAPAKSTGPQGQVAKDSKPAPAREAGRVPASPLARKLAREHDLDLGQIEGSGPHGRVVKTDVDQAIAAAAAAPAAASAAGTATAEADADGRPYVARPSRTIKLSQMRKTIAKRMGQSKREAPHIYLTVVIGMDRALALRAELNLALENTKVSVNDVIVAATAKALRKHPRVNSSYTEAGIVEHGDVHVGIAIALDDGLVVTPIRHADQKTLAAISVESRDYATRAKARTLKPEEMVGSTFTISNLGGMGIESFCAIVNPGETAILAVGATQDEAVVENGQIVARKRMRVTLCSDHRAFDGADSARFLGTLKKILENPLTLFA
jgi:pyruvate dehydrogenase E2 component (dihydrolipoamide acetyltransferase)